MMKKKILNLLLASCMLIGSLRQAYSQNFEGIATYESSMDIGELSVMGQNMSPEMQESLTKQIAQQSQRTYKLTFNVREANWKEEAELDPVTNSSSSGGMQIRISSGGGVSYLNPGENTFLEETEIFGKKFLIEDELPTYKWTITNETKKIGDYNVVKAEFMNISEQTVMALSDSEQTSETVMDTTMISAWYTPEIPVSQGPDNTWGLPGLILELKRGEFTYLCTKVELNPANAVTIEKPSKGKKVSREEADKIRDERMQEMMKKYDTGEDGSQRVIIRTGG